MPARRQPPPTTVITTATRETPGVPVRPIQATAWVRRTMGLAIGVAGMALPVIAEAATMTGLATGEIWGLPVLQHNRSSSKRSHLAARGESPRRRRSKMTAVLARLETLAAARMAGLRPRQRLWHPFRVGPRGSLRRPRRRPTMGLAHLETLPACRRPSRPRALRRFPHNRRRGRGNNHNHSRQASAATRTRFWISSEARSARVERFF